MSIHKIKNYNKRDTKLNFTNFIFNDDHIFEKLIIIEDNKRLLTTYKKRKNEIFEFIFNLSQTNNIFTLKIYYKL